MANCGKVEQRAFLLGLLSIGASPGNIKSGSSAAIKFGVQLLSLICCIVDFLLRLFYPELTNSNRGIYTVKMSFSPCQYNRSGQKSGSSAAIKYGVKLLLSVTNKKRSLANSLNQDQTRRLSRQINFYHGSET